MRDFAGPVINLTGAAARHALATMKGDKGRLLEGEGTTLVVPTKLEKAARTLVTSQISASGASNPCYQSATLIMTARLD